MDEKKNDMNETQNITLMKSYIHNLIEKYVNESYNKVGITFRYKVKLRNLEYLKKIIRKKNKIVIQSKNYKIETEKMPIRLLISLNESISILLIKYKKDKNEKNNKIIIYLHKFLQKLLTIIGISFILGYINDCSFESIIKTTLNFSLENTSETKTEKIKELKHIMFFNESIKIIKFVFNYFEDYSEEKKELMKNIIIYINSNILGTLDNNNLNYSNKYFLCKNDYKTSLLIDLSPIIIKMKSTDITKHFIDLLTNIYSFQFRYDNCMKPTLKLFEPLLINLNNKKIDDLKNEIDISDFPLNYIDALNNKEKKLLERNPCIIKQGFYFGNQISGIYGDINNLDNDFVIIFSLRIESDELKDISIFDIYCENRSQIKLYLEKTERNEYELKTDIEDNSDSAKVHISLKKTYIFIFQFMLKKQINMIYIKENEDKNKKEINVKINAGNKRKLKNVKQNNLKICIGCQFENNFQNNFIGFMGDFIILNVKHLKENKYKELYEEILKLKSDYCEIIQFLSNDKIITKQKDQYYNLKYNSIFNQSTDIFEKLQNNKEFISNFTINTIISQKYFKLVEYKDDINYIDNINKYDSENIKRKYTVKFKYFNLFKSESNYKKSFIINTSFFNRHFHVFERKFTIIEFVNYGGIYFLSLIFEYYYQISCHLIQIKDKVDKTTNNLDNLNKTFEKINEKIINVLNFFHSNIIITNLYKNKLDEIKQFFYQMISLIFKLVEFKDIHINIIKSIYEILITFDGYLKKKDEFFDFLLLIRKKLFEFLINPRLYKPEKFYNPDNSGKKDDSKKEDNSKDLKEFDKHNYIFLVLLTFFKSNKSIYLEKFFTKENLDIFLSYMWLLDKQEGIKNLEITRRNYISFFVLFLHKANSFFNSSEDKRAKSSKNVIHDISENSKKNSNGGNQLKSFINQVYEKALSYRKNHYIFFNLTSIMVEKNYIYLLDETEIVKVKKFFLEEIENDDFKNTDIKKILYLSYLQILISFYILKQKSETSKNSSNQTFQEFLENKNLCLAHDLFYALIFLIKKIKIFEKLNNKEIIGFNYKDLGKISFCYDFNFKAFPIEEKHLESFNDLEIDIIKNILSYILILFEEYVKRTSKRGNNENINNDSTIEPIEKEVFEVIKKYIDMVFKNMELYMILIILKVIWKNIIKN